MVSLQTQNSKRPMRRSRKSSLRPRMPARDRTAKVEAEDVEEEEEEAEEEKVPDRKKQGYRQWNPLWKKKVALLPTKSRRNRKESVEESRERKESYRRIILQVTVRTETKEGKRSSMDMQILINSRTCNYLLVLNSSWIKVRHSPTTLLYSNQWLSRCRLKNRQKYCSQAVTCTCKAMHCSTQFPERRTTKRGI